MEISEEKFHCACCGKDVLLSNQATHEALCARMQRQGQQEPIQQEPKNFSQTSSRPVKSFGEKSAHTGFIKDDLRSNKVINCPNCNTKVPESDWQEHQRTSCANQQIPCEFCAQNIPIDFYSDHAETCSLNPSNINNNPESVKVPCEFCGRSVTANVYEQHANECAQQYDSSRQQQQQERPQQQSQRNNNQQQQQQARNNAEDDMANLEVAPDVMDYLGRLQRSMSNFPHKFSPPNPQNR
jgi:hypothetical protein